jgi:hypothetical protein
MSTDMEVQQLRASTHCATVLEKLVPGWKLDKRESTRHCLKFRRGPGEILIINHGGRGWWDPQSEAKGDVFDLVQRLRPSLNFGMVRRELRQLAGIAPSYPTLELRRSRERIPMGSRWQERPRLTHGSRTWRYLADHRALPPCVLVAATAADVIREGPSGSAWFAHRDGDGAITGIEMRGPKFRGFTANGTKPLFRLPGSSGRIVRIVLGEGPITVTSLAAFERLRADTLYAATGGGMGPETIAAIQALLASLVGEPSASLVSAADNDAAGKRHAARHEALALEAQVRFERLPPPNGLKDWNDVLRRSRGPSP